MRTTLTLDDDVAAAIEHRRRDRNHSLKQEVNELLRAGLRHVEEQPTKTSRFRVEPLDAGGLLIDVDDVSAALDFAEGRWRS
jgi:plasmid stability protein